MKLVAITSILVLTGLLAVGCGNSSTPAVTPTTSTGPVAPKTEGGNKPAVAGVGMKGSDMKTAAGDPGFGGKAH